MELGRRASTMAGTTSSARRRGAGAGGHGQGGGCCLAPWTSRSRGRRRRACCSGEVGRGTGLHPRKGRAARQGSSGRGTPWLLVSMGGRALVQTATGKEEDSVGKIAGGRHGQPTVWPSREAPRALQGEISQGRPPWERGRR
jgi:hypothetical protein